MSNIRTAFEHKKAFIAFITCGDPDLETTGRAVRAAAENGADLIELGIPFSDPTAEGPVIQEANIRALRAGATTDRIFEFVRELRRDVQIPLVCMTYANVVFSYGAHNFIARCQEVGIDGLILPDVPFEEREEFLPLCRRYGVDLISVIAPTSGERAAMIAKEAEGFLYIDYDLGAAGAGQNIVTDLSGIIETVRRHTDIPCVAAIGDSTPKQAAEVAQLGDGVIAGETIVKILETYGKDAPLKIGEYVKSMTAYL